VTTEGLRKIVRRGLDENKVQANLNSVYYNGGVIVTLFCTGAATILSGLGAANNLPVWLVPILSGVATFIVGIDRALQLGQRWVHHRTLFAKYNSLYVRLQTLDQFNSDEQANG
jgi:hypothetical protein